MPISKLHQKLLNKLDFILPKEEYMINYRPGWLNSDAGSSLELDVYIPDLKIAIEVQGEQHFKYIPHFHSNYEAFLSQKRRDERKKDILDIKEIRLFEVLDENSLNLIVDIVRSAYTTISLENKNNIKKFIIIKDITVKKLFYNVKTAQRMLYSTKPNKVAKFAVKILKQCVEYDFLNKLTAKDDETVLLAQELDKLLNRLVIDTGISIFATENTSFIKDVRNHIRNNLEECLMLGETQERYYAPKHSKDKKIKRLN